MVRAAQAFALIRAVAGSSPVSASFFPSGNTLGQGVARVEPVVDCGGTKGRRALRTFAPDGTPTPTPMYKGLGAGWHPFMGAWSSQV